MNTTHTTTKEGSSTPEVEQITISKLNLDLISARLERGEMRRQRDELLAACKELIAIPADAGYTAIIRRQGAQAKARAVIARAEESTFGGTK